MNQTIFIPQEITDASSLPKEGGKYTFFQRENERQYAFDYGPEDGQQIAAHICRTYSHWLRPVIVATPQGLEDEAKTAAQDLHTGAMPVTHAAFLRDGFKKGYIAAKSIPSAADLALIEFKAFILSMEKHMAEQYMRHDYRSMYDIWKGVTEKASTRDVRFCGQCGKLLGHSESFTGYDCQTVGCTENPLTL